MLSVRVSVQLRTMMSLSFSLFFVFLSRVVLDSGDGVPRTVLLLPRRVFHDVVLGSRSLVVHQIVRDVMVGTRV